jgi:S-formylglutathione hydrolase FrmB
MASGRMEFHARTIMQHANFSFVLPNDVEMEEVFDLKHYERDPMNLILLHGLTGTDTDRLYGGVAQLMAIQYNLNIFMPTTGNSFYLDKGYEGRNYASFIAEELPDYISSTFGIKMERENTMIGGLSMGGYGTLHTAFAFPERFSACIALSSALVVRDIATGPDSEVSSVLPVEFRRELFGDPAKLLDSDINPEVLFRKLKESGADIPKIYMACGTEDNLIDSNRYFADFLKTEGADVIFEEGPGRHTWQFWNEYIDRGLKALLG